MVAFAPSCQSENRIEDAAVQRVTPKGTVPEAAAGRRGRWRPQAGACLRGTTAAGHDHAQPSTSTVSKAFPPVGLKMETEKSSSGLLDSAAECF